MFEVMKAKLTPKPRIKNVIAALSTENRRWLDAVAKEHRDGKLFVSKSTVVSAEMKSLMVSKLLHRSANEVESAFWLSPFCLEHPDYSDALPVFSGQAWTWSASLKAPGQHSFYRSGLIQSHPYETLHALKKRAEKEAVIETDFGTAILISLSMVPDRVVGVDSGVMDETMIVKTKPPEMNAKSSAPTDEMKDPSPKEPKSTKDQPTVKRTVAPKAPAKPAPTKAKGTVRGPAKRAVNGTVIPKAPAKRPAKANAQPKRSTGPKGGV